MHSESVSLCDRRAFGNEREFDHQKSFSPSLLFFMEREIIFSLRIKNKTIFFRCMIFIVRFGTREYFSLKKIIHSLLTDIFFPLQFVKKEYNKSIQKVFSVSRTKNKIFVV